MLVDSCPDLTSVGEAGTGAQAVDLARRERPDVVLMDVRMPEHRRHRGHPPHLRRTRRRRRPRRSSSPPSTSTNTSTPRCAPAPAASCSRTRHPPTCSTAIRVVAAGEALLAPSVTRRLIARVRPPARARSPSPRAGRGSPTGNARSWPSSVAACPTPRSPSTCTSPPPPQTHVGRLLTKLSARDRAQLVITAYETHLVTISTPPARRKAC